MAVKEVVSQKYVGEGEEAGFEFTFMPMEDSITIKKTKAGYEARYLVQDDNARSPDEDGDDGLFLVGYHHDFYVEGPRTFYKLPEGVKRDPADKGHLLITKEEAQEGAPELKKEYHIFGLEAYIHSGVALALSQEGNFCDRQWDVSQLGLVFVSKAEWKTREKAREAARGLIATWNSALSGDVYGIVRETYDKNKKQLDQDSCWGYYGYDYALKALKTDI